MPLILCLFQVVEDIRTDEGHIQIQGRDVQLQKNVLAFKENTNLDVMVRISSPESKKTAGLLDRQINKPKTEVLKVGGICIPDWAFDKISLHFPS